MTRRVATFAAVIVLALVLAPASAWAQKQSLFQPYFGYSVLKVNLPSTIDGQDTGVIQAVLGNWLGWHGGITTRVKGGFGAVADFAGYYRSIDGELDGDTVNAHASLHTFLFGPRFSGSGERIRPFGQALFGFGRLSGSARLDSDNSELAAKDGFAASFGGGADFVVHKNVAIRTSLDFFPVRQSNENINEGKSLTLKNFRFGTGIVFYLK